MFTQITKEQNMNYKEIKNHNNRERRRYYASWDSELLDWTYKRNNICMHTYIAEQATSDEGMTIKDKLLFHMSNPNGVYKQMPKFDDFVCLDDETKVSGAYRIYDKHCNHHIEKIRKLWLRKTTPKKWTVEHHIQSAKEDIESAKKLMFKQNLKGSLKYKNSEVA